MACQVDGKHLSMYRDLPEGASASYPLSIDLGDIRHPLGQCICRHLIAVLVPELCCLGLCALSEGSGVGDSSRHDATDGLGNLEDVRYG